MVTLLVLYIPVYYVDMKILIYRLLKHGDECTRLARQSDDKGATAKLVVVGSSLYLKCCYIITLNSCGLML